MAEDKSSGGFKLIHIDFSKVTQPVTAFINRVSEAFGVLNRPGQTVRDARARARADKIKALGVVEVADIQRRAQERWLLEEAKKQENIESITEQAVPLIKPNAKPEGMESDWITHFFEKSRIVSDKEMQSLWARLLAGEANVPGTFSKRTVECVSLLDKADAAAFTQLCGFAWTIGNLTPIVMDVGNAMYSQRGILFTVLTHLDAIGLIRFESVAGFALEGLPKYAPVSYFGRVHVLEFPNDANNRMEVGATLFTKMGSQLAPIAGATAYEGFEKYIIEKWKAVGIKVVEFPVQGTVLPLPTPAKP